MFQPENLLKKFDKTGNFKNIPNIDGINPFPRNNDIPKLKKFDSKLDNLNKHLERLNQEIMRRFNAARERILNVEGSMRIDNNTIKRDHGCDKLADFDMGGIWNSFYSNDIRSQYFYNDLISFNSFIDTSTFGFDSTLNPKNFYISYNKLFNLVYFNPVTDINGNPINIDGISIHFGIDNNNTLTLFIRVFTVNAIGTEQNIVSIPNSTILQAPIGNSIAWTEVSQDYFSRRVAIFKDNILQDVNRPRAFYIGRRQLFCDVLAGKTHLQITPKFGKSLKDSNMNNRTVDMPYLILIGTSQFVSVSQPNANNGGQINSYPETYVCYYWQYQPSPLGGGSGAGCVLPCPPTGNCEA